MRRESESPGSRLVLLAVGLSALVGGAAILRHRPPAPKPASVPSSEFSAARARDILRRLVGDGAPHPVGSPANARVRERVVAELTRLGYATRVQESFVCGRAGTCATVRNVLAWPPGRVDGRAVLLCAHYDSVGAGPGASDDGMGVAALLEIARTTRQASPPRNPIVFLVDDGEEAGMLGAEAFAFGDPWARRIGAVINLENRGTSGPSFLFETSDENRWLIDLAARSILRPATSSFLYTIYKLLPNDTDLTVLREHGMAGVNFAAIGDEPRYHTPRDDFENASTSTLQHHGDNALAIARALAASDLSAPRRGNAVFFDLFGACVARWPEEATPWLAGTTIVLLAAGLFLRWRAGALAGRALLLGLVGGLAIPSLAVLLGLGASGLLKVTAALPVAWIAHPGWLLVATWTLGLFSAALVAAALAHRAGPAGLWGGVWSWYGATAFALALAMPGVSFLFLVPAACAAVLGLVAQRSPAWRSAAVVAPASLAAFFWLPIAWLLYTALGSKGAAIAAGAVGLWAAVIVPAFALVSADGRRAVLGLLAAVAVIALAGATWAHPFSPDVPQRMSIVWHEDADDGRARWLLFAESNRLSGAMRKSADWSKQAVLAYPWSGLRAFTAEAAQPELPGPDLHVLEDSRTRSGRRIRAILGSPRAAPIVFLAMPPSARARVVIAGRAVPPLTARWLTRTGGWQVFSCLTTPPEGVEIEIVAAGSAPLELFIGDRSPGLPTGGEILARARGATAVASQDGDTTVVTRRLRL